MLTSITRLVGATLFSLVFGTAAALAEGKEAPETISGTNKVSAEQAVDLIMNTPDLVVIDSRKSSDREASGWIEGSVALPDYDTSPESLAKHLKSKDTPVLFYCNGVKCGRSVTASNVAVAAGYSKIYWFRGGWEEWTGKGMPVAR